MSIKIHKLTNCNVYVDGNSYLGRAEEIDIPDLNFSMAEHKGLGLFGKLKFPSGLDQMEARIKWNALYPDAMKATSNPYKAMQLMVRGSLEVYEGGTRIEEQSVSYVMTGQPMKLPGSKFKQHDNVELESTFTVTRAKLVVAGETIFEVDVTANICTIAGEDILAQFRANQ